MAVSTVVHADPVKVWALVSDPANYARWSRQVTGLHRLRGSGAWSPGDSWIGTNRLRLPWATRCTVVRADAEWLFAFTADAGPFPISLWSYELSPVRGGTEVTERWVDQRFGVGRVVRLAGPIVGRGRDAASHNLSTMRQTLDALKAEAEA